MAAGAIDYRLEPLEREETLALQVLGILHEVLARPGLSEEAKDGLRRLIEAHRDHPERALLEHLCCLRTAAGS
ncbi:hypothetical protein SAT01_16970 [Sinomonas atrocyanea]|nr:hypothetical protein SAT01_16970 [Sinomonas atrocyanea]GGG57620.1 hypothetical protein GCM10007172_05580 [Sinomonas atrocyanea]